MFENAASGTVTIIGVVAESQSCSNTINGIGASMPTQESLAEIGIKSYDKEIKPNWWFIVFSFLIINGFVYITLQCFIQMHETGSAQSGVIRNEKDANSDTLYYDKLKEMDDDEKQERCLGLCKRKQGNKVEGEVQEEKKSHKFAVSYKDMEKLLEDFNTAQAILKRQLKDRDRRDAKQRALEAGELEEGEKLPEPKAPEDELIEELCALIDFMRQNNEVVDTVVADDAAIAAQEESVDLIGAGEDQEGGPAKTMINRLQKTVTILLDKQNQKEQDFESEVTEAINQQQKAVFDNIMEKNERIKKMMQDEYMQKLGSSKLTPEEQALLKTELDAKIGNINDLMEQEKANQNSSIDEMLARRRAKKEKLKGKLEILADKKQLEDDHYNKKLAEIAQKAEAEKANIEGDLRKWKRQEENAIEDDLQARKKDLLSAAEKAMQDFKKKKMNAENEYEFAEMLAEYGKKVKDVEALIAGEKSKANQDLEERLKQRRKKKQQDIEDSKAGLEAQLQKETVATRSQLAKEMDQLQSLLKPVKDEDERLERIAGKELMESSAINHAGTGTGSDTARSDLNVSVSSEARQAESALQKEDTKEVDRIQKEIDRQNAAQKMKIAQQREQMQKSLESASTEADRDKLREQMESYEKTLQDQIRRNQDEQNSKLKSALEARRAKRKQLRDKVAEEKHANIADAFNKRANQKVNGGADAGRAEQMADKIATGFDKDQQVQVGENYLDKKNKQELIDLMNALFEERAKALRKHMAELLLQKQGELDDLRLEYGLQKDNLRKMKADGLLGDEDYENQMEVLNKEEQDKKMDIEISYADKEAEINEDLEKAKLEAEAEQKGLLKDRQTAEKVAMFKKMMDSMDENDEMKKYLEQQTREAEVEQKKYER